MISISVRIGMDQVDTVEIWNTGEKLFGQQVYGVKSFRNKVFQVLHDPRHGIWKLISHVTAHYAMVDSRSGDTPTTTEEI